MYACMQYWAKYLSWSIGYLFKICVQDQSCRTGYKLQLSLLKVQSAPSSFLWFKEPVKFSAFSVLDLYLMQQVLKKTARSESDNKDCETS